MPAKLNSPSPDPLNIDTVPLIFQNGPRVEGAEGCIGKPLHPGGAAAGTEAESGVWREYLERLEIPYGLLFDGGYIKDGSGNETAVPDGIFIRPQNIEIYKKAGGVIFNRELDHLIREKAFKRTPGKNEISTEFESADAARNASRLFTQANIQHKVDGSTITVTSKLGLLATAVHGAIFQGAGTLLEQNGFARTRGQ